MARHSVPRGSCAVSPEHVGGRPHGGLTPGVAVPAEQCCSARWCRGPELLGAAGKVGSGAGSSLCSAGSLIHLHNGGRTKAAVLSPRAKSAVNKPRCVLLLVGSYISVSARCAPPRPFSPGDKEGTAAFPR